MNDCNYRGKRVMVTGHTGFKGSWLVIWLHQLGAKVYGYSLKPPTTPSNYELAGVRDLLSDEVIGDIRDRAKVAAAVRKWRPDIVFHLAAQPLVRLSYECPHDTFEANVLGTASVLDAVRARVGDLWWYSAMIFLACRSGDVIQAFIGLWLVPKYAD